MQQTYFFFEKLTRAVVKAKVEHNEMSTLLFIVSLLFCTKMSDWAWGLAEGDKSQSRGKFRGGIEPPRHPENVTQKLLLFT